MNAVAKAARREVSAALRRAVSAATLGDLSDREFVALLRESPIAEQVAAEARAAQTEKRSALVNAKQREIVSGERDCSKLRKDYEAAETAVAVKRAELSEAQRALDAAHGALVAREIRTRYAVSAIDAELELLAPDAINTFIARLNTEWERLRAGSFELVGMNLGGEEAATRNAEKSLQMEARSSAIAAAEELKHTALDGEPLLAELNGIEANMLDLARAARAARG